MLNEVTDTGEEIIEGTSGSSTSELTIDEPTEETDGEPDNSEETEDTSEGETQEDYNRNLQKRAKRGEL